jgi:hypothetical protein
MWGGFMYLNKGIDVTLSQLLFLGFTPQEVQIFNNFLNSNINLNINRLEYHKVYGVTQARVLYLKKLQTQGLLDPDNLKSFSFLEKHFKRMSGDTNLGVLHLPSAGSVAVYQRATVAGITDTYFRLLNSGKGVPRIYKVVTASPSKVVIQVDRQVGLKVPKGYLAPKNKLTKIPNVLEVQDYYSLEQSQEFFTRIAINSKYARVINQYVILAGTREPQGHLGCVKSVTSMGKILYVYAKPIYTAGKLGNTTNERVYALDYNLSKIPRHINRVMELIISNSIDGKWKVGIKYQESFPSELADYSVLTLTDGEIQAKGKSKEEEW